MREPVTYVQIDQDFCSLEYGEKNVNAYLSVPAEIEDLVGASPLTPANLATAGVTHNYGLFFEGDSANSYASGPISEFTTGTIEAIFKPSAGIDGLNATVIDVGAWSDTLGQATGWGIWVNQNGEFGIHDSGAAFAYSSVALSVGTAYRLSATYDGSSIKLYVRPEFGSTSLVATINSPTVTPAAEVWVGRRPDNQIDYNVGTIADLRTWTSVRSQSEIDDAAFDVLSGNEGGLSHYWPFGDVTGCLAVLGLTGEQKCFRTRATCQSPQSYDRGTLSLTFTKRREDVGVDGLYVIPSLRSISTVPTRINPGASSSDAGALGERASVDVTFVDHPHSDVRVDPYRNERNYIATDRGTFWSKWLARNPYHNNRRLRIYEGYRGQTLAEMQQRTYIIDSISGPDANGRVKLRAKDILKLADDDTAQAPKPSQGELNTDITADQGTVEITNYLTETDYPPGGGTVRVGDEVMTYTAATYASDICTLTGVTRGADGTEAEEHDAEDRVQLCLRYTAQRVDAIAYDLLTKFGNVPAQYINLSAWQAEADVWLNQYTLTALITEPTGVTKLVGELAQQCIFNIWWDEREQLIPLEAVKPPSGEVVRFDDERAILAGSARLQSKPKERISQVWLYYGIRNPTKGIDEESNFRQLRIRADTSAESAQQYGEQRIRKIYSRWLRTDAQVLNATTRLLSRFRNNPRYLTLDVDAKDRSTWTGDVVDVTTRGIVDIYGEPRAGRWQVISAEEVESGHRMRYTLETYEYGIGTRYGVFMIDSAPLYGNATEAERAGGCWFAGPENTVGDNDEPYRYT